MKYAIIKTGGKQYKVSEKDVILIDKISAEKSKEIIFPEVLLVKGDEDKIDLGTPFLSNWKVKATVLEEEVKGEKVITAKFKAKVHYRRKVGFRARYTKVQIDSIVKAEKEGVKPEKKEVKKTKKIKESK
jgi:large subunit ribosomal protein L21